MGAADAGSKGDVVLSVGPSSMTAGEVERRLRDVPGFQINSFGATPEQIKKRYVETVLVPELLYYEEAKRRGLEKSGPTADRVRDRLRQALETEIRDSTSGVSPDEIKSYYDANRHRFNTPRRIKLWRILVKDEESAKKLIASLKRDSMDATSLWSKHARDSLDKATAMRDGDLGFVTPEGQTEMPQVRVEPSLFEAADKVKDGEVVPEPLKEGEGYAVIWRRGSLEAVVRTLAQEAPSIRQILARQKVQDAVDELGKRLEREHVKGVTPELLSYVTVDPSGDVGTRQRPGVIPRHRARGAAAPERGERGLR